MPENLSILTSVLKYQIIPAAITTNQFQTLGRAKSLADLSPALYSDGTNSYFGFGRVLKFDGTPTNGFLYSINLLQQPGSRSLLDILVDDGHYLKFTDGIIKGGYSNIFGYFGLYTVFAPTDGAFQKLPSDVFDGYFSQIHKIHV